jgi:hypothetical protein
VDRMQAVLEKSLRVRCVGMQYGCPVRMFDQRRAAANSNSKTANERRVGFD